MVVDCPAVNRTRTFSLVLLIATGATLCITTRVDGCERQVLAALVTMGVVLATVVTLFRSVEVTE